MKLLVTQPGTPAMDTARKKCEASWLYHSNQGGLSEPTYVDQGGTLPSTKTSTAFVCWDWEPGIDGLTSEGIEAMRLHMEANHPYAQGGPYLPNQHVYVGDETYLRLWDMIDRIRPACSNCDMVYQECYLFAPGLPHVDDYAMRRAFSAAGGGVRTRVCALVCPLYLYGNDRMKRIPREVFREQVRRIAAHGPDAIAIYVAPLHDEWKRGAIFPSDKDHLQHEANLAGMGIDQWCDVVVYEGLQDCREVMP